MFTIGDEYISLRKRTVSEQNAYLQQQGRRVTGTVKDVNGEPVMGASVVEKGTTNGTATDHDGNFTLNVGENATLQIHYLGFKSLEISDLRGGGKPLEITLLEDTQTLDEVVVVGYGTQKRSDLIGSVGSITGKSLEGRAQLTVQSALQGKIPGVAVTQTSGQPGATPTVRIRGIGTVNNNDPLYIVDGVPMGNLEVINNEDIETIEVLKDAASASIYGSRAGNGVVIVTTKKGGSTKPTVFYDLNLGYNEMSKKLDLLNTAQYTMIVDEQLTNTGMDPYWKTATPRADTDWQEVAFQRGFIQSHVLGIRGSSENIKYYISVHSCPNFL
jgi:TonB-linked SusC/RagA family outer membrane protein